MTASRSHTQRHHFRQSMAEFCFARTNHDFCMAHNLIDEDSAWSSFRPLHFCRDGRLTLAFLSILWSERSN